VNAIDHATTLGDLVLARPAAATLFEQLGLDFCCGGRRTLEQACSEHGLDAKTVSVLLNALQDAPATPAAPHHDVARSSIAELCDHIVAEHHDPLRADLERISELLATVVRVHGDGRPELHDLQGLFATTRDEVERHLRLEEDTLFPACRALDANDAAPAFDETLLAHLVDDHDATGAALGKLRELSGGYADEQALCGTHRRLLQSLSALELDMHQHVHEENNSLFPRVRDRLSSV
jgi:regulator of cell morphogenesis and NO signaling